MSLYRPFARAPRSDVHHVAEHLVIAHGKQQTVLVSPEQIWITRRKAKPAEFMFPTTLRWMTTLPPEFQPKVLGKAFPRVANTLAALWTRADAFTSYLDELLVDKRGGRRGFALDVLAELQALRSYYAVCRPDHPPPSSRLK